MKAPKIERPLCLACRKPLRTEPSFRHRDPAAPRRFGDYGDDLFCGLNCGYRFAVSLMGEVRRGEAEVRVTAKGRAASARARREREARAAAAPAPVQASGPGSPE